MIATLSVVKKSGWTLDRCRPNTCASAPLLRATFPDIAILTGRVAYGLLTFRACCDYYWLGCIPFVPLRSFVFLAVTSRLPTPGGVHYRGLFTCTEPAGSPFPGLSQFFCSPSGGCLVEGRRRGERR